MIILGDASDVMPSIKEVHAVFADLPYGTTQNAWDTPIDLPVFWRECWRILPERGPVVCNAAEPFTSALVMSQPANFRHDWIWEKTAATGHLNARRCPLRAHESVLVFCRKGAPYYPQKTTGHPPVNSYTKHRDDGPNYGATKIGIKGGGSTERYPRSVQVFASDKQRSALHPTQKPLALMRYLVRTYTLPGQVVLDPTCGSGTTLLACALEGRSYIGIESDPIMHRIAVERLKSHQRKSCI